MSPLPTADTNGKVNGKAKSLITSKCRLLHEYVNGIQAHLLWAEVLHTNGKLDRAIDADRTALAAMRAMSAEVDTWRNEMGERAEWMAAQEKIAVAVFDGAHAATATDESEAVDTEAALAAAIDATFGPEELGIHKDIQAIDAGD